jgi:hypothetical protein
VDEGLPALGAFRHLFREALLTRLAGVPMLAVLGRSCFGGASMLACLCSRRIFSGQTRLGTSGPGVVEALEGSQRFDSADPRQVAALFGAEARRALLPEDSYDDGSTLRARVSRWLESACAERPWDAGAAQTKLGQRLRDAGILADEPTTPEWMQECARRLLLPGYVPSFSAGIFWAAPPPGSGKAVFAGCLSGTVVTARDCWILSQRLLELGPSHPGSPIVLVLDAESHAATIADEQVLLADYLVHLSLIVSALSRAGHRTALWLPGAAAGAAYVAFAAPVDRVFVLPSARVSILPAMAQQQIIGQILEPAAQVQSVLDAGVADSVLDSRLESYARARPSVPSNGP